jgi:tRNA threonylcarbamoyladenosine biosynthesis protein TsaE
MPGLSSQERRNQKRFRNTSRLRPDVRLGYTVSRNMTTGTITHSAEETIAFGRALAADLSPPLIVLLRGDLGGGKTTLVKGIAEGFSAANADDVTSPTFTLVHEYRGPQTILYHIDLYRIDTEAELRTIGLEDLLAPNCILLIEWGEKFPRLRRDQNVEITLERAAGETERRIAVTTR